MTIQVTTAGAEIAFAADALDEPPEVGEAVEDGAVVMVDSAASAVKEAVRPVALVQDVGMEGFVPETKLTAAHWRSNA